MELSIASNTSIKGFDFENASITNYSTSNITIANNTFTGSVDGNGPINFDGATDVLIHGNTTHHARKSKWLGLL